MGFKIGRVEQNENSIAKRIRASSLNDIKDPSMSTKNKKANELESKSDKIIVRELKEIITTGTVYNPEYLNTPHSIHLAALVFDSSSLNFSVLLYDARIN